MLLRVYIKGNYFFVSDEAGSIFNCHKAKAKVYFSQGLTDSFDIHVDEVRTFEGVPFSDIKDENGNPYMNVESFVDFFTINTGEFSVDTTQPISVVMGGGISEIEIKNDSGNPVPVTLGSENITITGDVNVSSEVEINNDAGNPIPVREFDLPTYVCTFNQFQPTAGAQDIITIVGNGTKKIQIVYFEIFIQANANTNVLISMNKRSTLNSGGTSTTQPIIPLNSTNPASTATVRTYTANPITGTLVGKLEQHAYRVYQSNEIPRNIEDYYGRGEIQNPSIENASELISINLNGANINTGQVNGYIKWIEIP